MDAKLADQHEIGAVALIALTHEHVPRLHRLVARVLEQPIDGAPVKTSQQRTLGQDLDPLVQLLSPGAERKHCRSLDA